MSIQWGWGPLPVGGLLHLRRKQDESVRGVPGPGPWEACHVCGACPHTCGEAEVLQTRASSGTLSACFYYQSGGHHHILPQHNCMCAKSLQSCLALCHHMDCSPPGCSIHGILQERILECGVGRHALLQGIFSTQRLNPLLLCVLHRQVGSLPPAPLGRLPQHRSQCHWAPDLQQWRVSEHRVPWVSSARRSQGGGDLPRP